MIALPTSSRGGFAEDWTMVFSMPKIFACTWWKLREDQQAGFSHIERYMLDIYIYTIIYIYIWWNGHTGTTGPCNVHVLVDTYR